MPFDKLKWYSTMGIKTELYQLYIEYIEWKNSKNAFSSKSNYRINNIGQSLKDQLKKSSSIKKEPAQNIDNIDDVQNLSDLYDFIYNYDCDLKRLANKTVIFDGNSNAKLMLIGEAPGEKEDVQGIPFCGESGELLNNMLDSIGFTRQDVYITNSFFWRPPANRTPTNDEILSCRKIVEKHIALIKPKLIVLVGATAMNSVLYDIKNKSISAIRGQYMQYKNNYMSSASYVTCIFHPAYLLRQPRKKKIAWMDLINIKKYLLTGVPPNMEN